MWGYIESNPGPNEHCLSIIDSNIRSIRNKLEFVKNCFLDFDVICFTESHLDASKYPTSLLLSDVFAIYHFEPWRGHTYASE